jgi:tricorn protease
MSARNDAVKLDAAAEPDKEDAGKKTAAKGKDKEEPKKEEKVPDVVITLEGFERRLVVLPPKPGNFSGLVAVKGKIIFHRRPNSGSDDDKSPLSYYDLEKREEKTIIGSVDAFKVSADGSSILVRDKSNYGIIKVAENQKVDKPLRTGEMTMMLNPREEWHQIFNDTWRRYRDFFYDPAMQQVDWAGLRTQYGSLVDHAITRWDVNNIIGELISELSAGHTYAGGGDTEHVESRQTGFLGIDWALDQGRYKIARIVRPAAWDNEVRSPFDESGSEVHVGDFILSVNGIPLDPGQDPYAAFEGLSDKTVLLSVSSNGQASAAREVVVQTLSMNQEARLRDLEWIEQNRLTVEKESGGQLAYLYMPNTGTFGQTELLRQFYGQLDKRGFIIDERFNAGGQLADRFLEMLNRSTLYYIGWRNGKDQMWPWRGNDGPKVMLINGWAGSGGDAFPWGFQEMNLGPIVGERTLGILVGPATRHTLIDNGYITVPDARLFGADGKWFAEGHGIEPTIEVWDDPAQLAKGNDPQLMRAIEEGMKLIKSQPRKIQPRPAYEDRTAQGIKD